MNRISSIQFAISGSWDWDHTSTDKGLFLYEHHSDSGELTLLDHILSGAKIGCTPVQGKNDLFYVVEERGTLDGRKAGGGGYIHVIRLNRERKKLEIVQRARSLAVNPSYCAVDPKNRYLAVVHHTSSRNTATKLYRDTDGTIVSRTEHDDAAAVLFTLNEDGTIGEAADFDVYPDEGNKVSLLHSVHFIPGTEYLVSADKGLDAVHIWKNSDGKLERTDSVKTAEGSDPRYIAFHPSLPVFYVNNEQKPVLYTFAFHDGKAELIHEETVMNKECRMKAMASDLLISKDGKHLYNALRICDMIAVYDIDQEGIPHFAGNISSQGSHNRGMALSPDGRFLYLCNMESDCIAVFAADETSGSLSEAFTISQSRASNMLFVR